ncbi:MAG: substrate-binding domain-containing protein [Spirochaetia bacterium]|nr:substrate-binding domain-containing protein [Spirochaetia bacterium]
MKLKKTTIGLFFRELADMYQLGIINNIYRMATKYDINVICFSGRFSEKDGSSDTLLFDIADSRNIDGLIVISSAIFDVHNAEQIQEFFARYKPLPMVSIGLTVPGYSSVTVDSHSGFERLMEHLFSEHSYRHPLFIEGPQGHLEADERYNVFRQVIKDNRFDIKEPIVLTGDFSIQSGRELISEYLNSHSAEDIDVIIASNDNMALGVMQALSELAIRVPDDIAVTGFDNNIESTYVLPNLTTVNQPVDKISEKSVMQILALISGEEFSQIMIPTEFIHRQSCGCMQTVIEKDRVVEIQKAKMGSHDSQASDLTDLVMRSLAKQSEFLQISERLEKETGFVLEEFLRVLSSDVQGHSHSAAHSYFVAAYYHNLVKSDHLFEANSLLLEVKHTLARISCEPEMKNAYLSKLSAIELFAVNCIKQSLLNQKITNERKFVTIQKSISLLTDSSNIYQLMGITGKIAVELAFSKCYIALFETANQFPVMSRLFLSYQNGKTNIPGKMGIPFHTRELFPPGSIDVNDHFLLVMKPLIFQGEHLGFILFEMNAREDIPYIDSLSLHLSSAIKSVGMMEKLKNREKHLQIEVDKKTRQLRSLNEKLQQDINERKQLEEGILQISSRERERIGSDIHDILCQDLAGISMLLSAQANTLHEADRKKLDEIIEMLNGTTVRARQMARGYFNIGLREDGLIPTLKEYTDKITELYNVECSFFYDDVLEVSDMDVLRHLYYLVQEAILNALKHAQPHHIYVYLRREQRLLILEVADDGSGLPGNFMERKGLGFHLMQYRANIISAKFSACKNNLGGTSIYCSLPLQVVYKEDD